MGRASPRSRACCREPGWCTRHFISRRAVGTCATPGAGPPVAQTQSAGSGTPHAANDGTAGLSRPAVLHSGGHSQHRRRAADPQLRDCIVDAETGALEHEAERLARLIAPEIRVDLNRPGWDLRPSAAELKTAEQSLSGLPAWRPIVAMAPGSRVAAKDWGEARWNELIGLLRQRLPAVSLVFVGAPDERALIERWRPNGRARSSICVGT